ncbi:predicted protein [Streptomyces iranensis]|uniref:Uncharacterized protein n=1 Tax=Streptomyces iranensis TaxID=576784 RepID=A0A060ZEE6_9ACTN|nr:predicted protein [Streptomyces iranensis]
MACDRSATTRAPSSNDNAPATTAAAISPCECPTTAAGDTPHPRHTSANDTITAHKAGCTTSTRSNPGPSPRNTPVNDQSTNPDSADSHSANRRANTGEQSSNSTAIPTHCDPCPGNTNTGRASVAITPPPRTTRGDSPPDASAPSASISSSRSPPRTSARWSKRPRVVASEWPTSAGDSPGRAVTCVSSRSACARRPAALFADSTHGTTPPPTGASPSAASSECSSSGASSMMVCTLVPLAPKAEMAARRGSSPRGHSLASVSSSTAPADQSIREERSSA